MIRRIAVCDDDKVILRQLAAYLEQIRQETGDDYDLLYYTSGQQLLDSLPAGVQLILLDIGMQPISGMDTARQLRQKGVSAEIIFITSMTEYALQGYEVHAFAYLCKPVIYNELKQQIVDCFARTDRSKPHIIAVNTATGTELVEVNKLLYAEVLEHTTYFSLQDRTIASVVQLHELERQLCAHGFFRCHRSYLINLQHIQRIDSSEVTMTDGKRIPISKYRRKDVLNAYSLYMGVRL